MRKKLTLLATTALLLTLAACRDNPNAVPIANSASLSALADFDTAATVENAVVEVVNGTIDSTLI